MTNYEKYKDEILAQLGTDDCEFYNIALVAKNKTCNVGCTECHRIVVDWLEEEYKEPKVDWSEVEIDTPVLVSRNGIDWINRYFAKYDYNEGIVYAWANGTTSWSVNKTANNTVGWDFAKLYKGKK